jgi:hypothetical protein
MANPVSLDVFQQCAVALIEYACGGAAGRDKDDPVYSEVTEGRDRGANRARYSSCADLYHWLMKRLGVQEKWVNRTDDGLNGPFQVGANVSHLAWCPIAFAPTKDWTPSPGDCVMVWDKPQGADAHVMAWLGPDEAQPGNSLTGNYGAGGMSAAVSPGAKIGSNKLHWNGQAWVYGTRTVRRSIRLADAYQLSTGKIDVTGAPGTIEDLIPQVSGEVADAADGLLKSSASG